jgi:prophage regulatory protein
MSASISILRRPAVEQRTGLSASSIDRLEAAGNFPVRMQISPGCVGWMSNELDEWIASRPRGEMVPGLDPVAQVKSLKTQIEAHGVIRQPSKTRNTLCDGDVRRLEKIADSKIASGAVRVLGNINEGSK